MPPEKLADGRGRREQGEHAGDESDRAVVGHARVAAAPVAETAAVPDRGRSCVSIL
jgi:hypothetical protein